MQLLFKKNLHYAIINLRLGTNIKSEWWLGNLKEKRAEKKTVSLCTCALFLVRPRRGRWARASSHAPHQCRSSAATSCVCAPHSLLEAEHNSKKTSVQPHHLGCRRNARQIRSSGQSRYLWRRGVLVVGDLGPKVSRSSRKPGEIGWVKFGRSSSSAAAAQADGEPDGCGSPSATDSRRRLMIQFRCKHKTRLE